MKIIAFILVILSLSKLFIVGSLEKQELARDMFYSLKNNYDRFQKNAVAILVIDSLIGLICGLVLLL